MASLREPDQDPDLESDLEHLSETRFTTKVAWDGPLNQTTFTVISDLYKGGLAQLLTYLADSGEEITLPLVTEFVEDFCYQELLPPDLRLKISNHVRQTLKEGPGNIPIRSGTILRFESTVTIASRRKRITIQGRETTNLILRIMRWYLGELRDICLLAKHKG